MDKEHGLTASEGSGIMTAVDVIIFDKDERILLGKRLKRVGFGQWSFIGGHLRKGEKIKKCA